MIKYIKAFILGVAFLIVAIIALSSINIVNSGESGVVLHFGKITGTVNEGLHFVNPITTSIEKMNLKIQKEQIKTSGASKDLQSISAEVAINYHIDSSKVETIYRSLRNDYSNNLIAPKLQESLKSATAKYTAEELITKREEVKEEMKNSLLQKLENTGFIIDDLNIVDFDFSGQFNAAIEAKVTAEQKAKEAQNKLVQVQAEAQQSVEKAKAEAENIRLQSQAANNDKYVQLKQLEVQKAFADKWNGQLPANIYGSAPIPFLQLSK